MRQGIYGDFAGYASVGEENIESALKSGLVVLDTNALLHLYSFHGQARQDFLDILTKLGSRLFVPHQVMEEFWRNRRQALIDNSRKFKEREEIGVLWSDFQRKYDRWHRRAVSRAENKSETFTAVEQSVKKLLGEMTAHEEKITTTGVDTPTFEDEVLTHLERILEGRVGAMPSPEERREMQIEGERRVKERIPPGYEDKAKADKRSVGDYFVWAQAIREAESMSPSPDLVFITQDNKEDWWLYPGTEEQRARPELVAEYRERTQGNLYLLRTVSLLDYGSAVGIDVSPDTLDQARNVDEEQNQADWKLQHMATYLQELGLYNESRLNILKQAVEGVGSARGRVTRGEIASIMNVPADSTFRRITLPFKTVMNRLVEQDTLPEGLKVPFETGAGKFTECYIPTELVDLVAEALSVIDKKAAAGGPANEVLPAPAEQENGDPGPVSGAEIGLLRLGASDGAWAEGYLEEDNAFRVVRGRFRADPRPSAQPSHVQTRQLMDDAGALEEAGEGGLRQLKIPYSFTSPSQASSCVLFTNTSGYDKWKNSAGMPLGELLRTEELAE